VVALRYSEAASGVSVRRRRTMLQFAGTTVDGETSTVYPPLLASDVRY
jgi:hypothetical protein